MPQKAQLRRRRRSSPGRTISADERRRPMAMFSRWRAGQQDRRAAHVAVQLGEGDQRAGEGDRADGDAERQLDQALQLDAAVAAWRCRRRRACRSPPPPPGRRPGRPGSGRRPPAAAWRSSARAGRSPRRPPPPTATPPTIRPRVIGSSAPWLHRVSRVVADGDGHADHAQLVAAPAGHRAGQAAQRQDEQDARDEVERGRRGWRSCACAFLARRVPSSCTWPACAG